MRPWPLVAYAHMRGTPSWRAHCNAVPRRAPVLRVPRRCRRVAKAPLGSASADRVLLVTSQSSQWLHPGFAHHAKNLACAIGLAVLSNRSTLVVREFRESTRFSGCSSPGDMSLRQLFDLTGVAKRLGVCVHSVKSVKGAELRRRYTAQVGAAYRAALPLFFWLCN